MKKTCAGAEMHLLVDAPVQGESEEVRRTTSLRIVDSAGQPIPIVKPEEMKDYTAVGIGCAAAADGKPLWDFNTMRDFANALGGPMYGLPRRLKTMRSIAFASVTVPTVERTFAPSRS